MTGSSMHYSQKEGEESDANGSTRYQSDAAPYFGVGRCRASLGQ